MADKDEKKPGFFAKLKHNNEMDSRRGLLEEIFNDYYKERRSVYMMNFIRGIFFGLGSVLGGTILIAIAAWILSFFVNIPGIGDSVQQVQDAIQKDK